MDPAKQPYGTEQPPVWAAPPSPWSPPSAPPPAPVAGGSGGPAFARAGLLALIAVLTELVIVAAAANQWVSKKVADDAIGNASFWHLFEQSWLTYNWRVTPQSNLTRVWGAQLALDVTTLVISGLLIYALVRAAASTFWRAFFATWLSVLAATLLGAFVRGLILPNSVVATSGFGRLTGAVYGPRGPGPLAVVGAATLGLITALIVGLVAVQTRRPAATAASPAPAALPYVAPEQPPPYYGEHPSGAPAAPPWQDQHFEPHGRHAATPPPPATVGDQPTAAYQPASGDQPTAAYRPVSGDQPTAAYRPPPPREQQGGGYRPGSPSEGLPTTQFPRPPDDEDPHHQ